MRPTSQKRVCQLLHMKHSKMLFACFLSVLVILLTFGAWHHQDEDCLWSFGYGSNMDESHVRIKKNLQVFRFEPAILKGYKMSFNVKGFSFAEPSYAGVVQDESSETHGAVFCLSPESMKSLDKAERGYNTENVSVITYNGELIENVRLYIPKGDLKDRPPSRRYLNILIRGAKQLGLDPNYIHRLESTSTYQPPPEVLKIRQDRAKMLEDLTPITVQQLSEHASKNDTWVSVLGFVIDVSNLRWMFSIHRGRDITTRVLMQFHDIPMDINDDRGRPPYPIVDELTEDELDHISAWLDNYHINDLATLSLNPIIGYLQEFREQQESGLTSFELPKRVKYSD